MNENRTSRNGPADAGNDAARPGRKRLFFALWPDDVVRARIATAVGTRVRAARGRAIPVENLHVTLAFLGGVEAAGMACIEHAARTVRAPPFDLDLVAFAYWRRSRILSLRPEATPEALEHLVGRLWDGLESCGFEREQRRYRAHLTLAREARPRRDAPQEITPIDWHIDEFCLVQSFTEPTGARYQVLERWSLEG